MLHAVVVESCLQHPLPAAYHIISSQTYFCFNIGDRADRQYEHETPPHPHQRSNTLLLFVRIYFLSLVVVCLSVGRSFYTMCMHQKSVVSPTQSPSDRQFMHLFILTTFQTAPNDFPVVFRIEYSKIQQTKNHIRVFRNIIVQISPDIETFKYAYINIYTYLCTYVCTFVQTYIHRQVCTYRSPENFFGGKKKTYFCDFCGNSLCFHFLNCVR